MHGRYCFSPMLAFMGLGEKIQIWSYRDRLIVHLLFMILRNTFPHVIPEVCRSSKGPNAIKDITSDIKQALESGDYHYALRIDIRGYYANIDRKILLTQLQKKFDDPLTLKYLESIVTTAIDDSYRGVYIPEKGIPLRSALSPFFGSLYLAPLDCAFGQMDVFYARYVDDVIILVKTKHQYSKAKKRIFEVLRQLKLEVSPQKTRFSKLDRFHFLGIDFEVSQNPQDKNQVTVTMHKRSCSRALNKVVAMRKNAAYHAADIQRYIIRWATWWKSVCGWPRSSLLIRWTVFATLHAKEYAWLGRGLLVFEAMRCGVSLRETS